MEWTHLPRARLGFTVHSFPVIAAKRAAMFELLDSIRVSRGFAGEIFYLFSTAYKILNKLHPRRPILPAY